MLIKNLEIAKGKTVRKVVYVNGKKSYAVIKCIAIQSYKHSHGQDIRRRAKAER